MAQVAYRHEAARPSPDPAPNPPGARSRRKGTHPSAMRRGPNTKSNRCLPLLGRRQYCCTVDWMREEGETVCRHFIHDVVIWSRCGHFASGNCVCGRAQSEARNALLAVGFPVTLDRLQTQWSGKPAE